VNKKAAIELSMTTIIVIIIGITLLSLGLVWVKGLFGDVDGITKDSFTIAKDLIQKDMAPDDTFYVSGYSIKAKQGKFTEVYTGVQFFDPDPNTVATFSLTVTSQEATTAGITFELPEQIPIKPGQREGLPFGIRVPENIPRGETYSASIIANKNGALYESEVILIEII